MCVYEGPVCWAGELQLVALSSSPAETLGRPDTDSRGDACTDGRDFEPRDGCSWKYGGEGRTAGGEPWPADQAAERARAEMLPSLPVAGVARAWGPQGRNIRMGHVPPHWVARVTSPEAALAAGGPGFAEAAEAVARPADADLASHGLLRPPARVTWIPVADGAAYFAALSPGSFGHPWHFAMATFGLWAARRMNSSDNSSPAPTGSAAGASGAAGSSSNNNSRGPYRYRLGGSLVGGLLPPVGAFVVPTSVLVHGSNVTAATLPSWTRETLRLLLPPGARAVLPRDAGPQGLNISDAHWLCAARAVVLGEKSRLFTGAGDAHAWRRAAFAAAGVPAAAAWPAYPPRTITLLVRERWRMFTNHGDVLALLRATGLPVTELRIDGKWPWAQQVAAFAGTGILVATHGAALTNVIYMPPRSAIIEVSAYLGAVPVFRRIAEVARVVYHPVYARRPSAAAVASGMEGMEMYLGADFNSSCPAAGLPSADASLFMPCNLASKRSNIEAPLDELARVLDYALDDIGCRGGLCRNEDGSSTDFRGGLAAAAPAIL